MNRVLSNGERDDEISRYFSPIPLLHRPAKAQPLRPWEARLWVAAFTIASRGDVKSLRLLERMLQCDSEEKIY